ncbi:histidinol-phosphate aminotransferase [Parabacteroides sp. PF5-5]|uniref:histidinol-phosphate transaminase n=1 Tax=unclassified Parabacteroides TaxID=2649774 RepID=UPI002472FB56|nr:MULTISPECIES: histidinol-phosphate transaminase [unclassified Parabacteroides]MDH6304474.1 histidinol-phosphate aminotransferase [Parabacteroides sp. PH5-39]MDH6315373.1 histidinol-phosphate aminotransferase [Parabacteroides sp. PF5-13]MDH6319133.1 histidinol-phosphate aminotransferase [Parabacteroides sp. PH5-13]MDH6322863.1 histidinol-phosphate aminotransferase [Parabacteroides sp. PH5-8]MDH6326565.1 histidinol-phosphate aminotransferase [Parabacteroides sp. PH5-41]
MKNLKELVRPNIWNLKPYSSARDEFHGNASVFLDANESPYNEPYNRYPDPMQWQLKEKIASLKGVDRTSVFLGNGSDEPIDLLIRTFCEPGADSILTIEPTYGMYQVAADINNVACRKVKLQENFRLDAALLLAYIEADVKIVFLCSPNNPTGNVLSREELYKVLLGFSGIVVLDEAYIDFSSSPSFLRELKDFPNLVVLQTLSKAWGAAGIRLGMAFASSEIVSILNKVKYPYNINQLTQERALQVLNREEEMKGELLEILNERTLLETALHELSFVQKIYPSDANFILVKVDNPNATYNYLVEKGIIVRNRHSVALCEGCLRITVGTSAQNNALLNALNEMKK